MRHQKIAHFLLCLVLLSLSACQSQRVEELQPDGEETGEVDEETIRIPLGHPPAAPLCPEPWTNRVSHLEVLQYPNLAEPPARTPFRDPLFGTCLVRVTDRRSDPPAGAPREGLKNEYSRVQSFNADLTRILVRSTEANWYVYDTATLQILGQLPLANEPRWDASDPDLIYHNEEAKLFAYRLSTAQQTLLYDFAVEFPRKKIAAVWTRHEGSPSADSRYWGLIAQDMDWNTVAFLVFDLQEKRLASRLEVTDKTEIDSVTISPSGNYFLAFFDFCERGSLGTLDKPCGLMVYNRDFSNPRGLLRIIGHSDLAFDASGREVLVYQDVDNDTISMLHLDNGQVTPLWEIDFSHTPIGLHFSGRAFQAPGWALVSTHSGGYPAAYTWMDNAIFAIELKPGGRVLRLAHAHSITDESQDHDYWSEPHASVSPDFRYIVFTSNWEHPGGDDVDMYLIELPTGWFRDQ
jgi:hypothetical protein